MARCVWTDDCSPSRCSAMPSLDTHPANLQQWGDIRLVSLCAALSIGSGSLARASVVCHRPVPFINGPSQSLFHCQGDWYNGPPCSVSLAPEYPCDTGVEDQSQGWDEDADIDES
eukprot:g24152.t1